MDRFVIRKATKPSKRVMADNHDSSDSDYEMHPPKKSCKKIQCWIDQDASLQVQVNLQCLMEMMGHMGRFDHAHC